MLYFILKLLLLVDNSAPQKFLQNSLLYTVKSLFQQLEGNGLIHRDEAHHEQIQVEIMNLVFDCKMLEHVFCGCELQ